MWAGTRGGIEDATSRAFGARAIDCRPILGLMEQASLPRPVRTGPAILTERAALVGRARRLAWLGIGWHVVEAAIAIGAGLVAGSFALTGFGADSVVEGVGGAVVLWRFAKRHTAS